MGFYQKRILKKAKNKWQVPFYKIVRSHLFLQSQNNLETSVDVWLGVHGWGDAPGESWSQLIQKPYTGPPCTFVEKFPWGSEHLQTAHATQGL